MKDEFFKVVTPNAVFSHIERFATVSTEAVDLQSALGRIICKDIVADENLPGFDRAVMDGFAVSAASTFGASAANPAYLTLKGHVSMGEPPQFRIKPGEAAGIATGGMLPLGADSVVMKEHAEMVDDTTLEVHRPVAPGSNMVGHDEDFKKGELVLTCGTRLRSQELGLLAALGILEVPVYKKPRAGCRIRRHPKNAWPCAGQHAGNLRGPAQRCKVLRHGAAVRRQLCRGKRFYNRGDRVPG